MRNKLLFTALSACIVMSAGAYAADTASTDGKAAEAKKTAAVSAATANGAKPALTPKTVATDKAKATTSASAKAPATIADNKIRSTKDTAKN